MTPYLVGSVLFNDDRNVAAWVADKIPGVGVERFGPCTAMGVVRHGQFVGGVVYHAFRQYPTGSIVEVSIAFDRPDWAYPATLRTLFAYPFHQLDCVRMEAIIAASNKRARKFIKGLGFTEEGKHPLLWMGRETAFSYGMTRNQCRFLNGQKVNSASAAAA